MTSLGFKFTLGIKGFRRLIAAQEKIAASLDRGPRIEALTARLAAATERLQQAMNAVGSESER